MTLPRRLSVLALLTTVLSVQVLSPATASNPSSPLKMTIGDPQSGHIDIEIDGVSRAPSAIRIEMHQVGAPGSQFAITIGGRPVVKPFILTDKECHYDGAGSLCVISVVSRESAFGPLLKAFESGKSARIVVQNAGNVAMSRTVSLRAMATALRRT